MPVRVSYPGVYIQEVPSGVRTITGVSTSIAAFVGMVQRGNLNTPTNVLSFADYERAFGSDTSVSEMTDQVRLFFQNGGQQAYIMRIADNTAQPAQITVNNEFETSAITFEAKEAGQIGDSIRLTVDYNTARPEATFNLTVSRETVVNGEVQFVETESHLDLSMDPAAGRFITTVMDRDSLLVSAAVVDSPPDLIRGYSVGGVLLPAGSEIARINTEIGAGNTGRFDISVDGRAFVTVPLQHPVADDAAITSAINNALATSTGGQVTVTTTREVDSAGSPHYLLITSTSEGGSVRVRSSAVNDIAAGLGLGQDNGGLEVDGYALRRPAPTGFFSQLGASLDVFNDANALDALGQFLATTHGPGGTLDAVTLVDSVNGSNAVTPVYVGADGDEMWVGTVTPADSSLLNGVQNLDAIADAIESSDMINWSAQQYGYRIVLIPEFGSSDGDLMVTITSPAIGTTTSGIFDKESNVTRYRLGGYTLPAGTYDYIDANQGGNDGGIPQIGDYSTAFATIASEVDLFNLLILPRALVAPGQGDTEQRANLWGPASIFCHSRRAFLLIDPPEAWQTVQDVIDSTNGVETLRRGLVKDHSAIYWPRLQIVDPVTGGQRTVDPAGAIAGVMARIDSNRGVWKAPAGLEADIRSIRGLQHSMSDPENGIINPQAVNAIRTFPNGIVSWGARTMDGFDNSGNDDYKYVPVRRIALFIEESLFRGLKFAVFEPNDEPLWAQIRLAAGAFMNNLFRQGAFQGQKARDAYFVKVDSETTTQNDINLGIVNVLVGFAPLKPAEFVVITIQQMAGQVQT